MTGRSSSGRGPLTRSFAPWTLPWPSSGSPAAVPRMATQTAPLGSSVQMRARASLWAGTLRTFATPSRSSLGHHCAGHRFWLPRASQHTRLGDGARLRRNAHGHHGTCRTPTEMMLTKQCADVSKLMYHMRINGDVLDHDLLASFVMGNSVPPSAPLSVANCQINAGKPPQRSLAVVSAFARSLARPCRFLWEAATRVVPL